MVFPAFSYGSFSHNSLKQDDLPQDLGMKRCDTDSETDSSERESLNFVDHNALKKIGTWTMAVIVFYTVSGGPFGMEETIRSSGAFYSIVGFAIFPLIWSVPEALVTAELGSTFPEASGTVAWVEEAYGPFWGWLQGCLTWVSGVTDNAIYPVLFLDYALQMIHVSDEDDLHPIVRFLILACTCLLLTYLNYRGLDVVGDMSVTICVLSMSPFVVFCLVGMFKVNPNRWLEMPDPSVASFDDTTANGWMSAASLGGILWRPYLNNLFWNLNSFDSASCFAGEILNPGKAFPKAMFGGVILVMVAYLLPLLVALGATTANQKDWVDGYLVNVVSDTVGPWLGAWVVFAAGISNLAMFMSEMSSDAFQILGLAERGYLPKCFARRSKYGTPTWGLIVGSLVIMAMSVTDLSSLIEMLNFNYSISLVLEYCAFIQLRISCPEIERPYRIPLNTFGCCLLILPPVFFTFVIMMLASKVTYVYAAGTVLVSVIVYRFRKRDENNGNSFEKCKLRDIEAHMSMPYNVDSAPPPHSDDL